MRIISNFHDYYDSVQKYGQDKSIVYLRKSDEIPYQEVIKMFPGKYNKIFEWKSPQYHNRGIIHKDRICRIGLKIIFFCGSIFPVIGLEKDYTHSYKFLQVFGFDELKETLREQFDEHTNDHFYKNGLWDDFSEVKMKEFFSLKEKETELNLDLKCPIISFARPRYSDEGILTLNPVLKDVEFYREIDTGTAFQRIESFIGGVLPSQPKPTVKINEKIRLEKRGFDSKLSFRKGKRDERNRNS